MKEKILLTISLLSSIICFTQISFENTAISRGVNLSTGTTYAGNGVTFFDFDNDGWDDLSFTTQDGDELKFYKNFNGTFLEISLGEGLRGSTQQTKQINWVDFDNDGDNDLFITNTRNGLATTDLEAYRNRLYENTGNLTFTEITETAGLPMTTLGTYGASWGDYNNDGYLDVFISNRDEGSQNYLYKNNGNQTFTNVSNIVGIDSINHLSFCSAWIDINNDGWQDLYISNDKIAQEAFRNIMYKNNGDGTFTDISQSSGTNILIDAMTVTVGDYNRDGWFDIYVTNLGRSSFLMNNGDETFTDIATSTNTEFNSNGWGANFIDGDNDGDLDLFISGSLFNNPSFLPGAFYENNGGNTFNIPDSTGFENFEGPSYCNAVGDINNDGLPDIVETNLNNEPVFLWENKNTENNNWIKINLTGVISNRDGIGSVIELSSNGEKQYHYTNCGESFLSQNSGSEFFGLGDNTVIEYVKITWLSGTIDTFFNVTANQTLNILEGSSALNINDFEATSISIYPNPANTILHLKSQNKIENIIVYNPLGEVILKKIIQNHEDILNLNSLTPGLYFGKITTKKGIYTHKFIKN
jgi:hypothetical protein